MIPIINENIKNLLNEDALIQFGEQYIKMGKGKVLPEGAPYFIWLAELGYIRYLRLAAECFNYGIGCEHDKKLASKYYFESVLFEGSELSKRALKALRPELEHYDGDNLIKQLAKAMLYGEKDISEDAIVRFAELILAGEIREYARAAAYIPLKRIYEQWSYDCPLKGFRIGECVLHGIGCESNPFAAVPILEDAIDNLGWTVEDIERGETPEWVEGSFHTASDYIEALEEAKTLFAQAEAEAVRFYEPVNGYFLNGEIYDGDIYDYEEDQRELFEEATLPERIKRA